MPSAFFQSVPELCSMLKGLPPANPIAPAEHSSLKQASAFVVYCLMRAMRSSLLMTMGAAAWALWHSTTLMSR